MNVFGEPRAAGSLPADQTHKTAQETAQKTPQGPTAVAIGTVPDANWAEFVAWVDPWKDSAQAQFALSEFQRRRYLQPHCPLPLEARVGDQRVAGAYMVLLGARVAAVPVCAASTITILQPLNY